MNKVMTANWNSVVKDEDTVCVIGDFSMSKETSLFESILSKLNGRKILILGNHDKLTPWQYLEVGFDSVHTSLVITYEDVEFFLCHDPAMVSCVDYTFNLTGHIHGLWDYLLTKKNQHLLNVGVDVRDFTPISIKKALHIFREKDPESFWGSTVDNQ
jgi:calcineurin-like phosphoesterase family protein